MRFFGAIGVVTVLLTALSTQAAAQAPPDAGSAASSNTFAINPLSEDQDRELTRWLTAMEKWQRYDSKWENRPVHDGWAHIVERTPPPGAPDWLAGRCTSLKEAHVLDLDPRTASACRLLDDPRAPTVAQAAKPVIEKPPPHSSFATRIHLDVLATTSQMGARMYGIIGTHVSLVDVGRVQLFGPPGVLVVTVPDGTGGRRVTFGYTWGISVRLADIRLGGRTKNMTAFLNISKVWLGTGETGATNTRGYDIIGFSIAPRKKT
jgi:hypothetical protein